MGAREPVGRQDTGARNGEALKPARKLFVSMAAALVALIVPKPSANLRLEALHVRHYLLAIVLVGG